METSADVQPEPLRDLDGSSLTLRPEATASVMRAYIEHRLDQIPGLQKLYYIGPMFTAFRGTGEGGGMGRRADGQGRACE